MLYLYLQQLQDIKQEEKILDSVSELKNISTRMNEMLIAVGKNVIQESSFDNVILNQNKILIEFFVEQFCDNINFKYEHGIPIETINKAFKILKNTVLSSDIIKSMLNEPDWDSRWQMIQTNDENFRKELLALDSRLQIESFNYFKIYQNYSRKILPIVEKDSILQEYLETKLYSGFEMEISGLPF